MPAGEGHYLKTLRTLVQLHDNGVVELTLPSAVSVLAGRRDLVAPPAVQAMIDGPQVITLDHCDVCGEVALEPVYLNNIGVACDEHCAGVLKRQEEHHA